MRPPWLVLLVLALGFGGCAAPDESLPTTLGEAPATTTSSVPTSTSASAVTTVTTATSTTTTTSMPPTTSSTVPSLPILLRADGLGIVEFGDPADEVLTTLTELFGSPSYDTLIESPFELDEGQTGRGVTACHIATVPIFGGHICFDYIRVTSWSDAGLSVVFSDLMVMAGSEGTDYVEVPPSLRGYGYRASVAGPLAQTIDGISVGSTVRELMALGEQVTFVGPGCGDNPEFFIGDRDGEDGDRIYGVLDYDRDQPYEMEMLDSGYLNPVSLDPDTTVVWLGAGAQRSC